MAAVTGKQEKCASFTKNIPTGPAMTGVVGGSRIGEVAECEGHGRPRGTLRELERASARAPLHDGRDVMRIATSPLVLTGEPGNRESQLGPVDDLQMRGDS